MKSLWHDCSVTCAALNSAASRLSITMWRPLMPPDALHHAANALACCGNSDSRPGMIVFEASLNTAMLMVFWPIPRTDDDPPGPGSQILPTPGHWPLVAKANVRPADVAATADVDESATHAPASIMVATASVNAIRRMSTSPPSGTFTTSPN